MDKKFVEYKSENNIWNFMFVGYCEWEDFDLIIEIVNRILNPDELQYSGVTDMQGYFIKDKLRILLSFNSMTWNELLYKDTGNPEDLEKVRGWAKTIWDELQKRENEPVY
jgi:hypothetical protein